MSVPITDEWLTEVRARFEPYRQAMRDLFAAMENPDHDGAGLLTTLHAANATANDVPALLAALERLMPAQYIHGPEGCCNGDAECDEYHNPDGSFNNLPYCSHVEHRVATWEDVRRRQRLEWLVNDLRKTAELHRAQNIPRPEYDFAAHLIDLIDSGTQAMETADD
jgi:hypothetical protein